MISKPKYVKKARSYVITTWEDDPNKKGTKFLQKWLNKEELEAQRDQQA